MALFAEALVEEQLNRKGYFTIRSLKKWPNEIDLLAFRPVDGGDALHVEMNVSINPRGWIGKKNLAGEKLPEGKNRTDSQIEEGITDYVNKKYQSDNAREIRKLLLPEHPTWRFIYVYGELNHPEELRYLKAKGVECCSVVENLKELQSGKDLPLKTDSEAAHFVDISQLDLPTEYDDDPCLKKEAAC